MGRKRINLAAVVERQLRTEASVKDMAAAVDLIAASHSNTTLDPNIAATSRLVTELQMKLDSFSSSISARLDHLSSVCSKPTTVSSISPHQSATNMQLGDIDRKSNLIIFGVEEDRDISVWHNTVDHILHFVAGRQVDVVDMLRLGRFVGIW